jgi:hypothetical protein
VASKPSQAETPQTRITDEGEVEQGDLAMKAGEVIAELESRRRLARTLQDNPTCDCMEGAK